MNIKELSHSLDIIEAFKSGKKLEYMSCGCWYESTIEDLEQLEVNLFRHRNMYRIKQEQFKVIIDEIYKDRFGLDFKNRNECKKAFDEGKTIQYKISGVWLDFSLDTLPKNGSGYTYLSFVFVGKLFGEESNVIKANLRVKVETVTIYSRRALYKTSSGFKIIICSYNTCNDEIDYKTMVGFVKWIEDTQEHEIEV